MKTEYEVTQVFETRKNTQRVKTTSLARAVNSLIVRSRKTPDCYIELTIEYGAYGRLLACYSSIDGYDWQYDLRSDSWQRYIQHRLSQ